MSPIDGPEQRPYDDEWRLQAACRGWPPDLWFPPSLQGGKYQRHKAGKAEAICKTCNVRAECLDVAERSKATEGIWAGTTPRRRRVKVTRH